MTSTVVSIVPFETIELKPGIAKGRYLIPATTEGDFNVIHVEDSFYVLRIPATDQSVKVPIPSLDIARSIVNDFCSAHIGSGDEAKPGLFFLSGKFSKADILAKFKTELEEVKLSQRLWFQELVKLADDDWQMFHQHKMISDTQRYAAQILKVEREWMQQYSAADNTKECIACFSPIDKRATICPVCRTAQVQQLAGK